MFAPDVPQSAIRFGEFALDINARELQRNGAKVKLQGQPLEILVLLLERPGRVVTRDELRHRLWPGDTFVDFEHGLNAAVNRLREALSDSAEGPRFIETVPRRGYRFIANTDQNPTEAAENKGATETLAKNSHMHLSLLWRISLAAVVVIVGAGLFFFAYKRRKNSEFVAPRVLRRLTFDDGLQIGATWSPDGRFIAYSANRGGKFDIWLQQIDGGNPVQVTTGAGQNWQPDWSPDGKYIAYRSERGAGGLYIVPAVGGAGLEREISSFGYYPRWSPDSTQILFQSTDLQGMSVNRFYVVGLEATEPREVLKELTVQGGGLSAAWHPDGKRISAWVQGANAPLASVPTFWTAPVQGGTPVKSEIPADPEQAKSTEPNWAEWRQDFKFSWAPSGRAIYFERTFQGARNLWRMTIDPESLRATGIERLTTGPETDTQLSLSADGKKVAFTGANEQLRAWLFPFDSNRAQVRGSGHPITSPGVEALSPSLSADGGKLGFSTVRQDRWERWIKTLSDNRDIAVPSGDSFARTFPTWSPDGRKIAYSRQELATGKFDLVEWSPANRKEELLASVSAAWCRVWDWSRDEKTLLLSQVNSEGDSNEIWALTVGAHPNESTERQIASSNTNSLYQPQFSPDGRWVAFEAVRSHTDGLESTIYAVPATGGAWIQLTDGKQWDDKPRWSPDGRMIYFLSGQGGLFDLWGIRFDPVNGRRLGTAFLVKRFEDSSIMIPKNTVIVEISVTPNHLMVPLQQVSGGIWMLDNVDY